MFERYELEGGSWIEIARGWLGHADALYEHLETTVPWQQGRVWRYEKWIDEPRMGAMYRTDDSPHPQLVAAQETIEQRYGASFDSYGLAYYRNQRDSVAMHRDREMKWLEDTVVAIVTTGAQRPFLVQRRDTYETSSARDLSPVAGDLMVFGGRFQADWLHGVPKTKHPVRGRISIQWRYTSKKGAPDMQPSYYAPRNFSKGRT